MEDAASEISDWEVLSAPGGDDDVVLVHGDGGDVLRDHFALVLPVDGPWSGPASGDGREEAGSGSKDRVGWVSGGGPDLPAEGLIAEPRVVGVDGETAASSVLDAAVDGGATWSAEEAPVEAIRAETLEQEKSAAHGGGESCSVLQPSHHAVVERLGSDPATVALENSGVQLGDEEIDSTGGSSALEAVVTGGGMQSAQEDQEQGGSASSSSTSGCGGLDGEVKDDSLPVIQTPGAGEGERQVVVWWRLPFRLLHYCAWKVKPVWSISIAAALLGLAVLGRRMYRMRRKPKGLPQIKMAFDDKRASQLADRTTGLNEAFMIARRVPFIRTSSGAVLPWSLVQER